MAACAGAAQLHLDHQAGQAEVVQAEPRVSTREAAEGFEHDERASAKA